VREFAVADRRPLAKHVRIRPKRTYSQREWGRVLTRSGPHPLFDDPPASPSRVGSIIGVRSGS
jgi:hypothetical protein